MGKVTIGGKDITNETITIAGKKVTKIEINSKPLTFVKPIYTLSSGNALRNSAGQQFGSNSGAVMGDAGANGRTYTETVKGIQNIRYQWRNNTGINTPTNNVQGIAWMHTDQNKQYDLRVSYSNGKGQYHTDGPSWHPINITITYDGVNTYSFSTQDGVPFRVALPKGGPSQKLMVLDLGGQWFEIWARVASVGQINIQYGIGSGLNNNLLVIADRLEEKEVASSNPGGDSPF